MRVENAPPPYAQGNYVLLNYGKASHPLQPSERSYVSFTNAGDWVRCDGYRVGSAMTIQLLKPGAPPPPHPPPAPPTPPAPTPCATKFDFRRLGLRTVGMLISPYIPAGSVFQEPKGPYPDSQFDLSSMCSTAKHLFGVPGFLTQRDAWAGSFHELLTLETPRTDAPMHLPDGPPLHAERQRRRLWQADGEVGEAQPRHCSAAPEAEECGADDAGVTQKQRNRMAWLSALTHTAAPSEPELARMTKAEAARWGGERWAEWVGHGLGWRQQQQGKRRGAG